MKKNEVEKTEDANAVSNIYEVGYLFIPTIGEELINTNYTNLKDVIASFGGEMISDEMPKFMNLAYSMKKTIANIRNTFYTAYFGWFKFKMDREKVLELKKNLDLNNDILRFLILKTVRENTISTKRFVRSDVHKKSPFGKKADENEVVAPINKEEIDKEIDAMVSV